MDLEEEMKDIKQATKKIENISRKEGLREGISDGRDSNFQKSFDKGFEEGFKNGFLLGKNKGTFMATLKQTSTEKTFPPILEHVSRGSCEICKNNESTLDEEDINVLIENQNKTYENNIRLLNSQ